MGAKLSSDKEDVLLKTKEGLDKLSNLIGKVLDRSITQSEAAKELGISPQNWNNEANRMFMYRLHKMGYLSPEGIVRLLRLCSTPYERLAYDIFGVTGGDQVLVLSDDTENILKKVITDKLDDRCQKVLSLYYGLDGKEPKTLRGVAGELGITFQGVRHLLVGSIRKLRDKGTCVLLLPAYRQYIKDIQDLEYLKELNSTYDDLVKKLRSGENIDTKKHLPISTLNLSVRTYRCLSRVGMRSVGDILKHNSRFLLSIKGFGKGSLKELKDKLSQMGIEL